MFLSPKEPTTSNMEWISVFLYISLLSQASAAGASFEPFVHQPGIFLEQVGQAYLTHENWKLILHYNLTNYWHEWYRIGATVSQLDTWCTKSDWRQSRRDSNNTTQGCGILMKTIEHVMDEMEDRNRLFRDPSRKRRAPFEFMGTLMADLFGVMDQRDAEKYAKQIEELQAGSLQMRT